MFNVSVVGNRYRIAKFNAKYNFCGAQSTLHRKVVRINFANIKSNVTQSTQIKRIKKAT